MDLDLLRCFEAAATTLNFRAAATRVHLSPAAFSDSIRRLEEDVGAPLFVRSTRRVDLSDAGRRMRPIAREVLAGVARLREAVTGATSTEPFELIVGTRYELGLSWLCPSLARLERARAGRTLHLYCGDSPDLLSRLERGDLDAIIASMRLTGTALRYAAVHEETYVFVGTHPGVRGPADATKLTLVDVSRDLPLFRYFLDALPAGSPWPFARVEYMGGIGNIRQRLLGGDRVAVLPRYFVDKDLAAGRLVALMPHVKLRTDAFRLVWRAGHPHERELLSLAEELRRIPLR